MPPHKSHLHHPRLLQRGKAAVGAESGAGLSEQDPGGAAAGNTGAVLRMHRTAKRKKGTASAVPSRLSKKWQSHFFEKDAACRSALIVRWGRTIRTFAGRDVFSPTHMSPEKTNLIFSRLRARTLRGFFDKLNGTASAVPSLFMLRIQRYRSRRSPAQAACWPPGSGFQTPD